MFFFKEKNTQQVIIQNLEKMDNPSPENNTNNNNYQVPINSPNHVKFKLRGFQFLNNVNVLQQIVPYKLPCELYF